MNTLGITHSTCSECRRIVPAKIIAIDDSVFLDKICEEHGPQRCFVRSDVEDYIRTLRFVKPAWIPQEFSGDSSAPCPTGCGFCDRHEQHLCMPLVEITSRCDLSCPICLVDAGEPWDISLADFSKTLDSLIAAERQIDVLNLSGGEPLTHPYLIPLIDAALAHPGIVRVSVSTNGLALLDDSKLVDQLRERNVVVSLQFDGFKDDAYRTLRGAPLLDKKLRILELLKQSGVSTSLTMTVAAGVNDDQFPDVLKYFFAQPHLVSLMLQPLAFVGRGKTFTGSTRRLTLPDVVRLLGEANVPPVKSQDFLPLPCSSPLCFSLAFYLRLDSTESNVYEKSASPSCCCSDSTAEVGAVSLHGMIDASKQMDLLANRTVFGLDADDHDKMKDLIYEMWSGPVGTAPDSDAVMKTLRGVLDEASASQFDPRRTFSVAERRMKSIFIHAFQDEETFDLARVRRCCNAYPQPDGSLVPACVHNVLGRKKKSGGKG